MEWLVHNNEVLASLQVADTRAKRRRGLLGLERFDEVMYFPGTRSVHTVGMKFAIDVAYLDAEGTVLRLLTMPKNRLSFGSRHAVGVLEAAAGCFAQWGVCAGEMVELR